jgi:hypothetical protein
MRRTFLMTATAPLLFMLAGCLFLDPNSSENLFSQEGTIRLDGKTEEVVYYPVAYVRPPNLRLDNYTEQIVVVEQCADRFRIKNLSAAATRVKWIARGTKAAESTQPSSSSSSTR